MATQTDAASSGSALDPISAGLQAASMIANTIAGISDMNKRRLIEANLNLLSEKEQVELAQQMAKADTKNKQLELLVNTILAAREAAATRKQKAQTVKWILIGSLSVISLGILAWYLKRK